MILCCLVDVTDAAGVGLGDAQRRVMRRLELAALGIEAASRTGIAGVVF